jgi:chaperone required for assembly of F1-ATPase
MAKRGRPSSASLAVTSAAIEKLQRPDAPYDLTDEQSEEWWSVVNRMPADWFPRETHAMLAQYCRHVIAARRVAQLVAACEAEKSLDIERYDKLLKMQEREGRAISSLATRMRISQQATVRAESARKPSMVEKPWEFGIS